MIETYFMMTKDDVTIPDSDSVYTEIAAAFTAEELPYVGFKNVGLPPDELQRIAERIVADGRRLIVEIVGGCEPQAEIEAARMAVTTGADALLGGECVDDVLPVLAGSPVAYLPAVGDLATEAGRVHGTVSQLVSEIRALKATPGVDGVMLAVYRYVGDRQELLSEVSKISDFRLINAGSVDSAARVAELADNGFEAFTIGGAVLDHSLPAGDNLADQLRWIMDVAAQHGSNSNLGEKS